MPRRTFTLHPAPIRLHPWSDSAPNIGCGQPSKAGMDRTAPDTTDMDREGQDVAGTLWVAALSPDLLAPGCVCAVPKARGMQLGAVAELAGG